MIAVTDKRPCVLVFAGHDPSGGAGIQADIEAIAAQGAHAISIITVLTVQDNNRVHGVFPVSPTLIRAQFDAIVAQVPIAAVKVGILGSMQNAKLVVDCVTQLRRTQAQLPVVVDTVLASGHGDALSQHDPVQIVELVLPIASLMTPNLPELRRLLEHDPSCVDDDSRATKLSDRFACDVLLKGGHADGDGVSNTWFQPSTGAFPRQKTTWHWPRLLGEFHGSGCTLAAAIAGQFALGHNAAHALSRAQQYTQDCLKHAYTIAEGQLIPSRNPIQKVV